MKLPSIRKELNENYQMSKQNNKKTKITHFGEIISKLKEKINSTTIDYYNQITKLLQQKTQSHLCN